MSKPSDLQRWLNSLVQPYEMSIELDKDLRQIIWNLLLESNLLSLCGLDGRGNVHIKKQNGRHCKVEDSKRFIAGIFFTINKYLNEVPGYQLKLNIIEVSESILLAFPQLEKISNQLAMNPDYKSQKKKFKIPRKEKINQLRKDIRSWTNGLLKGISKYNVEKTPKTIKDKKLTEKVLIEQLYFCFRQCCSGLLKKDTYYNMAKIMLVLRFGLKSEQTNKKQIILSEETITTEAKRIQKNRQRYPCPGGLYPDFWCPIVFPKGDPHQ